MLKNKKTNKIPLTLLLILMLCVMSGCGNENPASHQAKTTEASTTAEPATTQKEQEEETEAFDEEETKTSDDDYAQYIDNSENTAEPRQYSEDEIDIDITEKLYVSFINNIYVNAENYIGDMIRIEGMYLGETYEGNQYYYVYRKGPGCCGNDGNMCGFEFTYNGDMPEDGDWIEVVGTLRQYMEGQLAYLTLDAISVTVKEERGAEEVKN